MFIGFKKVKAISVLAILSWLCSFYLLSMVGQAESSFLGNSSQSNIADSKVRSVEIKGKIFYVSEDEFNAYLSKRNSLYASFICSIILFGLVLKFDPPKFIRRK